jgi:hypothetical protein
MLLNSLKVIIVCFSQLQSFIFGIGPKLLY